MLQQMGEVLGKTEGQIHEMAAAGELDFATFADAMDKAFGAHATRANETYTGSLANMHAAMSRLAPLLWAHSFNSKETCSMPLPLSSTSLRPLFDL
jgi:hypothetical protein